MFQVVCWSSGGVGLRSLLCGHVSVGSHSSAPGVAIWEGREDASGGVASTGTPTGIRIRETDMGRGREGEVLQLNMADDVHTYRLYSGKVSRG